MCINVCACVCVCVHAQLRTCVCAHVFANLYILKTLVKIFLTMNRTMPGDKTVTKEKMKLEIINKFKASLKLIMPNNYNYT